MDVDMENTEYETEYDNPRYGNIGADAANGDAAARIDVLWQTGAPGPTGPSKDINKESIIHACAKTKFRYILIVPELSRLGRK